MERWKERRKGGRSKVQKAKETGKKSFLIIIHKYALILLIVI